MKRMRAAAVCLVFSACSISVLRPPPIVQVDADHFVRVRLGTEAKRFDAAFLSYFPDEVAVHPGDTVNFQVQYTGEPHTVTLGTTVDAAARAIDALGPDALRLTIEELAEVKALPHLFPDVPRAAAMPCFGDASCSRREQPEFTGRDAFFSSGWLAEGDVFRVRLATNIRPGTYHVISLARPWANRGRIVVRPRHQPRPRAYDVKQAGDERLTRVAVTLEAAAKRAADARSPDAVAGTGDEDVVGGYITAFGPRELRVRRGEAVSWRLFGTHAIAFNHPDEAGEGIIIRRDGRVFANGIAWRPAGNADGWDGEGFLNSGLLHSFPPDDLVHKVTFTRAGTYPYRCLVHEKMRGTVTVV